MNQYYPPGCAPYPSPMDCYTGVNNATDFITAILNDAIANNPATQQAIITMLMQSGSTIPLVGVTDGSDAQPGQVGEFVVLIQQNLTVPLGATPTTQQVSLGVLQPGDWDCVTFLGFSDLIKEASFILAPIPAGFSDNMSSSIVFTDTLGGGILMVSPPGRALLSVPTLLTYNVVTLLPVGAAAPATMYFECICRRRR